MKSNYKLIELILLWIMLLATLLTNNAVSLSASPATIVRVEPSKTAATRGENFSVNVTIYDVQNLFGLDIKLYWNVSVLEVIDADVRLGIRSHPDGVLYEDILLTKNETKNDVGRYWLAATSYNSTIDGVRPPSFNGSGNIVKLSFFVKNSGNTRLTLETKLADKPPPGTVAAEIASTTISGIYSPIHIAISPSELTLGESASINGFTALTQANVDVTIQNRIRGSTNWNNLQTVRTGDEGRYQLTWQPDQSEEYEIRASALLRDATEVSYSVDLTVKPQPQDSTWQYLLIIASIVTIAGVFATLMLRRNAARKRNRGAKKLVLDAQRICR